MTVLWIIINIVIAAACFTGMEAVAWFVHKYVMHGFLWFLHKDHHAPHKGPLEKNDLFVVIFALPAVVLLVFGIHDGVWPMISAGIGVTLYGVAYSLFHDVMFHRRAKFIKIPRDSEYFQRIISAHRNHHKSMERRPGESFGFLWAPKRHSVSNRP